MADALQGLGNQLLFPVGLGLGLPVLKSAAAATLGQNARRTAPLITGQHNSFQLRQPMAFGGMAQPHPHRLTGKGPRDEADLPLRQPGDTVTAVVEPGDPELELIAQACRHGCGSRTHAGVAAGSTLGVQSGVTPWQRQPGIRPALDKLASA